MTAGFMQIYARQHGIPAYAIHDRLIVPRGRPTLSRKDERTSAYSPLRRRRPRKRHPIGRCQRQAIASLGSDRLAQYYSMVGGKRKRAVRCLRRGYHGQVPGYIESSSPDTNIFSSLLDIASP